MSEEQARPSLPRPRQRDRLAAQLGVRGGHPWRNRPSGRRERSAGADHGPAALRRRARRTARRRNVVG